MFVCVYLPTLNVIKQFHSVRITLYKGSTKSFFLFLPFLNLSNVASRIFPNRVAWVL